LMKYFSPCVIPIFPIEKHMMIQLFAQNSFISGKGERKETTIKTKPFCTCKHKREK